MFKKLVVRNTEGIAEPNLENMEYNSFLKDQYIRGRREKEVLVDLKGGGHINIVTRNSSVGLNLDSTKNKKKFKT
jgi:hypothetical protein